MLRQKGAIPSGDLPAHKARIKLLLSLEQATDPDEIRELFDAV
jgi:L-asparaginase/Glu-tRNA(Gln) amidotransferase subunit D